MRKLLFLLLSFFATLSAWSGTKASKDLARFIRDMIEEQSIHPDSFYVSIARLEARKDNATNPTEKAVTQAVLGYVYDRFARSSSVYEYESSSDDTKMEAWSYDDYQRMSAIRYAEAMADFSILHNAKISDWTPIAGKGKDDDIYNNDMLMLVWRCSQEVSNHHLSLIPTRAHLINYYQGIGNRRAVLMLKLDGLDDISSYNAKRDSLLKWRDEYAKLDLCAEVYLNLSKVDHSLAKKVAWLEEGIKLYSGYKYKKQLQNELQQLLEPNWNFVSSSVHPYPGKTYEWVMNMSNVQTVNLSLYRLNEDFSYKECNRSKKPVKYIKKHATLVDEKLHQCSEHDPWQSFADTIRWKAPELGRYILVALPSTQMKLKKKVTEIYKFINVTRLMVNSISLLDGVERVAVNDAVTGAPVEGADLKLFSVRPVLGDTICYVTGRTDKEGRFNIQWPKDTRGSYLTGLELSVTAGDDRFHEDRSISYGKPYFMKPQKSTEIRVYTDRSIYRPGQTVHVGAVEYTRNDMQEDVVVGDVLGISLRDPNGKEVAKQSVETDSLGVVSCDFVLPESGLTGTFDILVDGRYLSSIRVEEYKRPTFEVKIDEAPAVQMPVDSICLTGRAVMYSGAPVRGAQVVGQFRWDDGYWTRWGRPSRSQYDNKLDTVLTDEQGRFKVVIPINQKRYALRYGQLLTVNYDVIAPSGETHTAQQSMFLCSAPLSLHAQVPTMIDKDKLTPWSMELVTSTGTEVQGEVTMTFKKGEKVVYETKEKSGHSVIPNTLKSAPSGRYDLYLESVVKGDTAKYKTQVVLFSQYDTKLPTDSTLWVYVPESSMSAVKSARVQVGTSKDVYLYYTLSCNEKVLSDRLIHMNDTVMTFDIPYDKSYDKGVVLNVMLVKDEFVYRQREELKLQQTDKQLKHKWLTFRDKLQPGQKETWQLQLFTPDDKPAKANLMASLYDASLDAIYAHNWNIYHPVTYDLFRNSYRTLTLLGRFYLSGRFKMKDYKVKSPSFGAINDDLFSVRSYGYVDDLVEYGGLAMSSNGSLRLRGATTMMTSKALVAVREESMMVAEEANEKEEPNGEPSDSDPVVTLRENFNETAFFYPSLRTNENGEVSLSFTLPESLTTWRLLGLAHTEDLLTTLLNEEVVAQKDLMAQLSLPRFFRQGDKGAISASIFNISAEEQKGRAVLTILDAESEKVMLKQRVNFNIKAQSDTTLLIPFNVPEDAGMLICRWAAEGSTCSDGEQRYLPILSNKEWITETKALTYTKAGNYREDVAKMFPIKEAVNKRLTVEYVSQPVWYAVQALPSMAWPMHDDILSLATAYYAGSLSGCIAKNNPNILYAINSWKDSGMLQKSKLLQNEDLKNVILQETPWIAEAEAETEKIQRLNTLFDNATQSSLQKEYLDKMRKLQHSDGSFSWFPGMSGNYYITREVAYLLTRLKVLTGKAPDNMITQAVNYIRKDRPTYLSASSLRYLYVLYQSGVQMDKDDRHNADSLMKVLVKHPEGLDLEERALAAIVLKKAGKDKNSERYLESVKKFLVTNDEGLTYFEFPQGSHRSINRKLHVHVQVMEALSQLSPKDSVLLDGMRRYLLRHKRTSEWDTPVNTANAVFALLLNNGGALQDVCDAEIALNYGKRKEKVESEGTAFGFMRSQVEVKNDVKTVDVEKKGNQESWGGIFAQYLAPVSLVQDSENEDLYVKVEVKGDVNKSTSQQVNKTASQQVNKTTSQQAGQTVSPEMMTAGSRVHVRYIITAKKDYEYVVLHAPRPASAEPVSQLSGYNWRDGLAFYRAVKDAAVNFYFDYLPRGSYVIEEDWLVERPGEFSTGITSIQCLYAPEFSAHTRDLRIKVTSNTSNK